MAHYYESFEKRWAFDPIDLQAATILYPVSNVNGIPTNTRWKNMPVPSSVLMDDDRVAYLWMEDGTNTTNTRAQKVCLGFADDEATFCTTNQSVTWADRIPLFSYGDQGTTYANVAASLSSAVDEDGAQVLVCAVVSDAQGTSMETGDRTRRSAYTWWMGYDTTNNAMYGIGGNSTYRTDRLWSVNTSTGEWTVVKKLYDDNTDSSSPWTLGDNAGGLAYNGTSMYAFDDSAHTLHTVDLTESQLSSSLGGTGVTGELDMAWDGSTMFGITATTLYQVNTGTGAWASGVACAGLRSIAYDSTAGVMYGVSDSTLYTVNTTTGALTSKGSTGLPDTRGLAYDPDADVLYCCDGTTNTVYSFDDPSTNGSVTSVGSPTHNNYVGFWPGWGTFIFTSSDAGATWSGGITRTWPEFSRLTPLSGDVIHDASAATNGTALYAVPYGPGNLAYFETAAANTADFTYRHGSGGPTCNVNYASSPAGVQVYFDEDAANEDERFLAANASGADVRVALSDGSFIRVAYHATPSSVGVPVYADDNAANDYQRFLFVSPTTTNGTYDETGRFVSGYPTTWDDDDAAGFAYRPHSKATPDPTVTTNAWAALQEASMGNAFLASDGNWYVPTLTLHRDDTFATFNRSWPALHRIARSLSTTTVQEVYPVEDPVDLNAGQSFPSDYTEYLQGSDVPGEGWIPGDSLTARDAYGGTDIERDHSFCPNLAELTGDIPGPRLVLLTNGDGTPQTRMYVGGLPFGGGLHPYLIYQDEVTNFGNELLQLSAFLPMADCSWDGKWLILANGSSAASGESDDPPGSNLGGLYYGPLTTDDCRTLADADWVRQTKTAGAHDCRDRPVRFVQGTTYVWAHWPGSTDYDGIKPTAVETCCGNLPPFEFPHPLFDVFDHWDRGDEAAAAHLLDRNSEWMEELLSRFAMCVVPEWPHPPGQTFVRALRGDPAARDALEDLWSYMTLWLSDTGKRAEVPFVATTRWEDVFAWWGNDGLVEAGVDAMFDEVRAWHVQADSDGTAALWKL